MSGVKQALLGLSVKSKYFQAISEESVDKNGQFGVPTLYFYLVAMI